MVSISGKSLMEGGRLVIGIVLLVAAGAVSVLIALLVAGTVADVATSGTIDVEGNFSAAIGNISETSAGYTTSAWTNWALVIGLIALVVIMLVFGIKMFTGGRKSGGTSF